LVAPVTNYFYFKIGYIGLNVICKTKNWKSLRVGCNLVGIEIFFYNDGTPMTLNYTAEIFNGVGETVSTPGNLLYSTGETVARGSWNQVNLSSPIPITSGMEIWAGFSISCPSAWPISIDNLPEVPKTSYFKNGTTGSFGELTTNLDIRLMVQK